MREKLLAKAIVPRSMQIHDGVNGEVLGVVDVRGMEQEYGAPYVVVHRVVLHELLCERAMELGVRVRTGARVVDWAFAAGTVVLEGGESVQADLVVVADGINGLGRRSLLGDLQGRLTDARPTGWAAYRLMAPMADLRRDQELVGLVDRGDSHLWLDDGASCMIYPVKDATMLNIVLSHRDDRDTSSYGPGQYAAAVDELMASFELRVRKLVDIAKAQGKIVNYPVWATPPLQTWVHESGRGVLLGDCAHAMAFWLSMGVSMATEDGVALAEALELAFLGDNSRSDDDDDIGTQCWSDMEKQQRLKMAMRVYEQVRKPRAEKVAAASLHAGSVLHMPKCLARLGRDESLKHSSELWAPTDGDMNAQEYTYGIAYKSTRDSCYGHDVRDSVRSEWTRFQARKNGYA